MHTLWGNTMSQSVGSTLALPDQTAQVQLIPVGLRKTSLLLFQIPTVIFHKTAEATLQALQLAKVFASTILENSGNHYSLKLVHTRRSCPIVTREIWTNFSLPAQPGGHPNEISLFSCLTSAGEKECTLFTRPGPF